MFIGAFALGFSWAKMQRESEKQIQIYVKDLDAKGVEQLLSYSRELMEKAQERNGREGIRSQGYGVANNDFPKEWKARQVSAISYSEDEVDYSWTGGIIGRIGIRVKKSESGLTIDAAMTPDTAAKRIYPIARESEFE